MIYIQKRKRLVQPRQANVPKRKKAGFPFILFGLLDPEGLSPFQWVRTLRRYSWMWVVRVLE
ncbi:hypothetical protein ACQCVP_18945 [Rossellomorea vietnamensis]|uniref:hypothetical protein n=1 Tax=Rossellomorea vietnamensis TaxID=218284 RepID=UPI003CF02ECB